MCNKESSHCNSEREKSVSENTFKCILISQFTIFTIPTVDSIGKHDVTQVLNLINWAYCGMETILTYLKHQYLNPADSFAKTTSCLYHSLKQVYLHVSGLFTPNSSLSYPQMNIWYVC